MSTKSVAIHPMVESEARVKLPDLRKWVQNLVFQIYFYP
ncbi:hypothetical protein J512_4379 [Acinetobacter baumannii 1295743]|uniref:Uncharacterized protein n=1 Tax=Acinetobacter baumannii (strain 1295743) TaxID=1310613 RepID=A0A009HC45_ACIB9|nr:hypothetical protein J512_4379 [Acinetobacter baumannii 1295743]